MNMKIEENRFHLARLTILIKAQLKKNSTRKEDHSSFSLSIPVDIDELIQSINQSIDCSDLFFNSMTREQGKMSTKQMNKAKKCSFL